MIASSVLICGFSCFTIITTRLFKVFIVDADTFIFASIFFSLEIDKDSYPFNAICLANSCFEIPFAFPACRKALSISSVNLKPIILIPSPYDDTSLYHDKMKWEISYHLAR
uniref:Uncharacterized protein n=1 Tax=Yersinia enterocolitica TaxID=630 RepID=B0RKL3_YEREN|nr:hypothetical protein [Yersinia enterocolitica]